MERSLCFTKKVKTIHSYTEHGDKIVFSFTDGGTWFYLMTYILRKNIQVYILYLNIWLGSQADLIFKVLEKMVGIERNNKQLNYYKTIAP